MDVILSVWKLLQLSVSPPQLSNLLLHLLQESFSPTHFSLLLISDQLFHLRAPSLSGADQLSKDPLTVLHCCLCRALLGDTERGGLYILTRPFTQLLLGPQTACSPQCASVGLSPTGLESGPTLGSSLADWRRALTEPWNGSSSSQLLSSLVSTHLQWLHSLSQILQLLLSLLDSLLEFTLCPPQLFLSFKSNLASVKLCHLLEDTR